MRRYFASFLVLFALAASAHAQNCSLKNASNLENFTQTPPIPPAVKTFGFPDVEWCQGEDVTDTYTVQVFEYDTCTNSVTNSVYAQATRTTFGVGVAYCSSSTGLLTRTLLCDPRLEAGSTYATSATDYNRFYIRAYDAIDGQYCGTQTTLSRQDFWQCQGVACPPPQNVGNCATCPPQKPNDCCTCPCGSPIILDITGKGYNLTSDTQGVMFDISGNGQLWQMSWTAQDANNAFLTLPGTDGLVHNGQQLFGNFTPQPPCPATDKGCFANGFRALAVYDDPKNGGNGDGIIDARDAIFSSLRLWIDANHDGISQPNELYALPALGINSISLTYKESDKTDQYGNVFRYRAQLNPDKPTDAGKTAYDIFFKVVPTGPTAKSCPAPPTGKRPASILKH